MADEAPVVHLGVPGAPAGGTAPVTSPAGTTLTNPVFWNNQWTNQQPTDLGYSDAWGAWQPGHDMGNGQVWFANPTSERIGTAQVNSQIATDAGQPYASVTGGSSSGLTGAWVPEFEKQHMTMGVDNNGQQGFTVDSSQVGNLSGVMTQGSRDNGKYAVKSSGFGLGSLLAIGAAVFGAPILSGWLAGGAATIGSDIAAGAIIGGSTSGIMGGNILKGAVLGGAGAGLGDAAGIEASGGSLAGGLATTVPKSFGTVAGIAKGAASAVPGALASGNTAGIIAGAVSGGVGTSLHNEGVPSLLAGAAGAVAGHYAAGVVQPVSVTGTAPDTGAPVINAPTTTAPIVAPPVPSITAHAPTGVIASNSTVSPWAITSGG